MKFFAGRYRKLTLLPLTFLLLGWLIYLVGFILLMVNIEYEFFNSSSETNFNHAPYFVAVICGPLLFAASLLHVGSSGLVSSLLGGVVALLSVLSTTGTGYVLYSSSLNIYNAINFGLTFHFKCLLMFAGTLMVTISWTVVLILSNFFTYERPLNIFEESNDYVVDEDGNIGSPPSAPDNLSLFTGMARKIVLIFLFLFMASWALFIIGTEEMNMERNGSTIFNASEDDTIESTLTFSTWTVSTISFLLVLCACIHAGSSQATGTIMGVITSLLSMLYLTCINYLLYQLAIEIHTRCEDEAICSFQSIPKDELYQIIGGSGTCAFWACVLAAWPFYYRKNRNTQVLNRRRQRQRDYLLQSHEDAQERIPILYPSD